MATDPTKVAEATPVLTGELLPDIAASNTAIVPLVDTNLGHSNVSIERAKEIGSKINLRDSQAILTFGVESEKAPTQISEQMLAGVRAKDTGPVGEALVMTAAGLAVAIPAARSVEPTPVPNAPNAPPKMPPITPPESAPG